MSFFIDVYTTLADYKAVMDRLTSFDQAIAAGRALGPRGRHPACRAARDTELEVRRPFPRAARRPPHRRGARAGAPARRERARDRSVGLRQVDPVPRHRRDLAVRRGRRSLTPAGAAHDAPAAAALHPDRNAHQSRRLSVEVRGRLRRRGHRRGAGAAGLPQFVGRLDEERALGADAVDSASSSGSRLRARFSRSRTGCSSTRRRRRSTSRPRQRSTAC